jgi:hypothetical protein
MFEQNRYAGDYREGYAVVRAASSGLCHHVDLNGKRIYQHLGLLGKEGEEGEEAINLSLTIAPTSMQDFWI